MIPVKGSRVKIFFRNGLIEEGFVESWSDEKSVIRSLNSSNLLVIQQTQSDVIAIKIITDQPTIPDQVYQELPELPAYEPDSQLRAMKLSDLHRARIAQEREQARQRLTTFNNSGLNSVEYGRISRISQPPNLDSPKKNRFGNKNGNR